MITLSLTTWSDHPAFIDNAKRPVKLNEYARYLPSVEVDSPFYGVPKETTIKNWQAQVPKNFQFILKANSLMTKHDLRSNYPATIDERQDTFKRFKTVIQPLVKENQLKTILFQFPPYFKLTKENLNYLRDIRLDLPKLPITIEFRSPSWYPNRKMEIKVAKYLAKLKMTEAIVDEPHNVNNGVPLIPTITNHDLVILRLHGRNSKGWFHQGKNWRKTRTLYCYNDQELTDLSHLVRRLHDQAKEVCVIFNNNSDKDAAPNALKLQKLLNLNFKGLAPKQIDLL